MNIVHVIFSFDIGGSQAMLVDIANEQSKKGNVSLIIVNNVYSNELLNKLNSDVKVFLIRREPSSKNIINFIRTNILLYKLKPDVIHCHNFDLAPLLIPFKRKLYLTVHAIGINTKYHKIYRKVFAISDTVKNDIISRSDVTPELIYNGIRIDNVKQRNDFKLSGTFKIVCVSRLEHEKKGQDVLIKAIHLLKSKFNIDCQLDLIGIGNSLKYLQELSRELKIENQVNFLGLKDRTYIYNNLCNYHLFVQPSRYEGFGLTVVEAMAAKIPVLVSNIDGPIEIIKNGDFGYSFESENPDDLADEIANIYYSYGNQIMINRINLAFNYAKENFDVAKTADEYINSYKY